jgi:uncharacterized membrane protein
VKVVWWRRCSRTSCGPIPGAIIFLVVFIIYQVYRLSIEPTFGLTALTIFDLVIAWLTYREYRKQRALALR